MSYRESNRHSQSSPSVTLEKGAYRMHAPYRRPRSKQRQESRFASSVLPNFGLFTTAEKQLAALIVLLALATVSCFGAAYYLYATRWATQPLQSLHEDLSDGHLQVTADNFLFDADSWAVHPGEQYLAYLPHSGFHNQRIAFENALVLSRILNRTLLAPPVRLGTKPIRYMNFEKLQRSVALSGKEGLNHCRDISSHNPAPVECMDYFDHTLLSWRSLMNLSNIEGPQKLIQRWDMSDLWLREKLNISQDDTFTLRDTTAYHFRFIDFDSGIPQKQKYAESIPVNMLANISARLLQIGTLFGSSRLHLRQPHNLLLRKQIRQSMTLENNILLRVADAISDAMGGAYLGAHIRIGDGSFSEHAITNVRLTWWKLVHGTLDLSVHEASNLEKYAAISSWPSDFSPPDLYFNVTASMKSPLSHVVRPKYLCRGLPSASAHRRLRIPLFISTDANDPLEHPLILPFIRTFPCTFFLSDFLHELSALDSLRNAYDGLMLKEFVLPFLDAIVCGKAQGVVGTDGSTFSAYVEDVLWRTYHGLEIAQSG